MTPTCQEPPSSAKKMISISQRSISRSRSIRSLIPSLLDGLVQLGEGGGRPEEEPPPDAWLDLLQRDVELEVPRHVLLSSGPLGQPSLGRRAGVASVHAPNVTRAAPGGLPRVVHEELDGVADEPKQFPPPPFSLQLEHAQGDPIRGRLRF